MGRLVKNELIKMFSYRRMYIFLGIITAMVLLACAVLGIAARGDANTGDPAMANPIPNGQSFPVAVLDSLAWFVIPLFVIIMAGFMISEEYGNGTLKLFLLHPVTRSQFILSKIISIFTAVTIILAYTAILSYALGTVFLGFGDQFTADNGMNSIFRAGTYDGIMITVLSYVLTAITLTAFGSIMVLVAINLSTSGATIGVGVGFLVLITILSGTPSGVNRFFISGYFKFHQLMMLEDRTGKVLTGVVVLLAYTALSYLAGASLFKRKDILN